LSIILRRYPNSRREGEIAGLIAPHAGYMYSGKIAAHAYKLIRGKNMMRLLSSGPAIGWRSRCVGFQQGGYETPLGVVPVEETLAGKIKKINKAVMEIPQAHLQEHSVEIQLPFLQVALVSFFRAAGHGRSGRQYVPGACRGDLRSVPR